MISLFLLKEFLRLFLQECHDEYSEKCKTDYSNECSTEYSEQCKTDYNNECSTEYSEQCKTDYTNVSSSYLLPLLTDSRECRSARLSTTSSAGPTTLRSATTSTRSSARPSIVRSAPRLGSCFCS